MNQSKRKIIESLLDKYEHSVLSKQGSKLNLKIQVRIKILFPKYDHSDYYAKRLEIDKAIFELADENLIFVTYKDEDLNQIILNIEAVNRLYEISNRSNINDLRREMLENLTSKQYLGWIEKFRLAMISRLEHYQSVASYFDENTIDLTFLCLVSLESQKEEISFRRFSQKVFKDSKFLEKNSAKIKKIISEFYTGDLEEDVFETFNVLKNPRFLYLKGKATISLNGQVIDLGKLDSPFSLMTRNIEDLEILDVNSLYVMTVENLTSFYEMNSKEGLVIYLGGFHHHLRGLLLKKIYAANFKVPYYHFGDLDAGGFNIYLHLIENTYIPFQMYLMDLKTLKQYEKYAKTLTQNDLVRLELLKGKIDEQLLDYMIEHKIKLEQEIIDFDEQQLLKNIGH